MVTRVQPQARAKELVHPAEPAPGYRWGLSVPIEDINPVEGIRTSAGGPSGGSAAALPCLVAK